MQAAVRKHGVSRLRVCVGSACKLSWFAGHCALGYRSSVSLHTLREMRVTVPAFCLLSRMHTCVHAAAMTCHKVSAGVLAVLCRNLSAVIGAVLCRNVSAFSGVVLVGTHVAA